MPSENQLELTEVHICSQPDSEICGFNHSGSKNTRLDHLPSTSTLQSWGVVSKWMATTYGSPKTPDITKCDKESVLSFAATEVESFVWQDIAFVKMRCVMALFIMGVPVVTSVSHGAPIILCKNEILSKWSPCCNAALTQGSRIHQPDSTTFQQRRSG